MKKSAVILLTVVMVGLLVGRFGGGYSPAEENTVRGNGESHSERNKRDAPSVLKEESVQVPRLVTSENLETLVAQGSGVSYASLALWLLDADAGEIAEYWLRFESGQPMTDKKRLLFFNWTRVDPQGALKATAGSKDADIIWWAWAASDPASALAAAGTEEQMRKVAKGLGEFQPGWLMKHFDEISKEARDGALAGLTTWKETDDAGGMLDFLQANGRGFQSHIFTAFALKDPWAAFDWLEKNNMLEASRYSDGQPLEVLIGQMKSAHPDDLERMAAMMPPGKMKRSMEDAAFKNLITTDPEKALKSAKETDAPLVAARRMAMIASLSIGSDPGKAFDIGAEILANLPGGLSPKTEIRVEDRRNSWSGTQKETHEFFNQLLAKDPERVLDMAATAAGESPGATFNELSSSWAGDDPAAYAEWVNRQTQPQIRKPAIHTLSMKLMQKGSYQEAADWAMASPEPDSSLNTLSWFWGRMDPEAAKAWFKDAEIPEKDKQRYLQQIKSK